MSGEGARARARSGVKHPGPRARVARQTTPATQTMLSWGLGFIELICSCTDACYCFLKVAVFRGLGLKGVG